MPCASHTKAAKNRSLQRRITLRLTSTVRAIIQRRLRSRTTRNAVVVQPKNQQKPLTKKVPCRPRSSNMGSADFGAAFVLKCL